MLKVPLTISFGRHFGLETYILDSKWTTKSVLFLQKLLNVNRRISVSPGVGGVDGSFLDVSVMSESLLDASKSFLGGQEDLVNETQLPESVFAFPADQIMKAVDERLVKVQ